VIYGGLYRGLVVPALILKDPEERNTFAHLRGLRRSQWESREELTRRSEERLRALVVHAATFVPYYRDLFRRLRIDPRDIRGTTDLQRLPPLTKGLLRENLERLTVPGDSGRLRHQTGGSTGEPTVLYIDNRTRKSWSRAACIRAWEWAGWKVGDPMCNLWGSYLDRPPQPPWGERIYQLLQRSHWIDAFSLSEATLPSIVERLRRLRPVALRGYASALFVVARFLEEHDIRDIRPKVLLTTTEKLYDHQRDLIERGFGCSVFDYYGNRETNLIAAECDSHSGYHVAIENALFEVAREGTPVTPGEPGDLLITDLRNFTTPLLRYEVGDQVTALDGDCPCGRGLPRFGEIMGRSHDIIVTPEGGYLHGELFTHAFWDCSWLRQFQIVQDSVERLSVLLVGDPEGHAQELENAMAYLRRYAGPRMRIDVSFVDAIPKTRSGKFRFVVSHVHGARRVDAPRMEESGHAR
jgi:phenylacetate-CoA ligase